MNKEEFEDYKKSIELVMGRKMYMEKDTMELFQKTGLPFIKAIKEMAIKDDEKAFMTMTTFAATLIESLTQEGKNKFVRILASIIKEPVEDLTKKTNLSAELFRRLRKERRT